jgi:hypothetical protein
MVTTISWGRLFDSNEYDHNYSSYSGLVAVDALRPLKLILQWSAVSANY